MPREREMPRSAAPLAERRVMPSASPAGGEKKKRERRERELGVLEQFGPLILLIRHREREVMAHFVKLIGSLERRGSELVPLNFSSDYTKELTG